jgi:hypothetical protein
MKSLRPAHARPSDPRIQAIEKTREGRPRPGSYHDFMTSTQKAETRTLTVVLNEADWRAFRAVEPDAVGWLHQRIQERLAPTRGAQVQAAAPAAHPLGDIED